MCRRGLRGRALRLLATLVLATSAFQVRGCNPAVRDTLLAGLETTALALTDTLIQSFFTALAGDDSDGAGGLTTT